MEYPHTESDPEQRFISRAELAGRYGVRANTVNRWVRDGRIPALRTPGGRLVLVRADVEAALAQAGAA